MPVPHSRKRPPKPLDPVLLEALALAYVARFATSRAKLETYLRRKLRERGWVGAQEPAVDDLAGRFAAAGYLDDAAYARAKGGSLLRRGYGPRRVTQALDAADIAAEDRSEVANGQGAHRRAALVMARKRRFGPFGETAVDLARREKQLAAMLRAGHSLDSARALIHAADAAAAEEWAGQDDDER
jgi:regulatory protein